MSPIPFQARGGRVQHRGRRQSTGLEAFAPATSRSRLSATTFVALHHALYAVVQIIIALTSGLDRAFLKLFQWVLFALIAVLAWIGA